MAIKETIVTGRKFRKLVDETNKLWQRISFWHKASDCEFEDGKTAETKLGAINGITDSLVSTSSNIAASAKAVSKLNGNLGGYSFGETADGEPGYRKPGADTVIPFNKNVTIKNLGAIATYDVKTLTPDYAKLTPSNFFVVCGSFSGSYSQGCSISGGLNGNYGMSASIARAYNPTTGILTVTISKNEPRKTGDPWYNTSVGVSYSVWAVF